MIVNFFSAKKASHSDSLLKGYSRRPVPRTRDVLSRFLGGNPPNLTRGNDFVAYNVVPASSSETEAGIVIDFKAPDHISTPLSIFSTGKPPKTEGIAMTPSNASPVQPSNKYQSGLAMPS